MSSPTRYQVAPSPTAEIRSQAIAKLKRAASIPRTPDGRRGLVTGGMTSTSTSEEGHGGPSSSTSGHSHSPSPSRPNYDYEEEEHLLNAGPEVNVFGAPHMQRTLSESSSFHIPTPPHMPYGSSTTSLLHDQPSPHHPGSDWANTGGVPYPLQMQGLSPVSVPPSAFPGILHTPNGPSRNTPSPLLPSLTDLRNLSRSNSAAARAKAMCKLTGQPETPTRSTNIPTPMSSDEDVRLGFHGLPGSRLTRSGTIGVPRMFGLTPSPSQSTTTVDDTAALIPAATQLPDTAFDIPRPRLQRSFTVSSTNMGEERRSAVGRRMVERLGERRAARQKEEAEVRKLWEESRKHAELRKSTDTWSSRHKSLANSAQAGQPGQEQVPAFQGTEADVPEEVEDGEEAIAFDGAGHEWGQGEEGEMDDDTEEDEDERAPTHPTNLPFIALPPVSSQPASLLAATPFDRTPSRSTERSDEFEYEAHLRRSLSSRTARNELMEASPEVALPSPLIEDLSEESNHEGVFLRQQSAASRHSYNSPSSLGHSNLGHHGHEDLTVPVLPFVAATRHMTQESVSSSGTAVPPGRSPGAESTATFEPVTAPQLNIPENNWSDNINGSQNSGDGDTPITETFKVYQQMDSTDVSGKNSPVRHMQQDSISNTSTTSAQDRAVSRMSWDEVSHEEANQSKKGSLTGRRGRAMLAALRKHSATSTASPPASPRHAITQMFGRRESESSASASQRSNRESPVHSRAVRHETSTTSLNTPEGATSANNMLLQHQLSNSSPVGFLPRADINDPRVMNSKLSPFPGINVSRSRSGSESHHDVPQLVHHHSEPATRTVNGLHATNGATNGHANGSHANGASHRAQKSEDSANGSMRRNWLGKPISASHTSEVTSDNHSRQGSNSSHMSQPSHSHHSNNSYHSASPSDDYRNGNSIRVAEPTVDTTPKERSAGTGTRDTKQRPEIPAFMVNRRRAPPPPIELGSSNVVSINDDATLGALVMPQRAEVLTRMEKLLSRASNDPANPDFLDDPPRKLLLSQQVLQVVNVHTVKDRYLFLFNDILVIAKPIITTGTQATLDMKFVVKSVVSLDKLTVTGLSDDGGEEANRHPAVISFVQQFADDAFQAVRHLAERSSPKLNASTLASLLFKMPQLDRSQLGQLLAADTMLLRAFIHRFHFDHVRIDDALRVFLLSIRLPTDIGAAETLLCGFADGYYEANQRTLPFDPIRARDLVIAILELNDMLYSTFGFAFPNHAISGDTFAAGFRSKDPNRLVPDSLLQEIYRSIRGGKLVQALASHETHLTREVVITPSRLPTKLTIDEWSEPITVTLPRGDPSFKIKLLGEGLAFDTAVLDFSQSRSQTFRVRGLALGSKSMLFERTGVSAAYYASIGNTRTFSVERSFMRNTFNVQFMSPQGRQRKYCFSVPDATSRQKWGGMLTRQVWLTTEKQQGAGAPTTPEGHVRRAAEAVSLQVLRDALVKPEKDVDTTTNTNANGGRKISHHHRVGSVSVAFARKMGLDARAQEEPSDGLQTGKELMLLCRQNSLLPSVLDMLEVKASNGGKSGMGHGNGAGSGGSGNGVGAGNWIPHSAQMGGEKPIRSAGLKALMHDRRL